VACFVRGRGFLFIRETTIVVFCFDIDKDYADLVSKQKSIQIICFLILKDLVSTNPEFFSFHNLGFSFKKSIFR